MFIFLVPSSVKSFLEDGKLAVSVASWGVFRWRGEGEKFNCLGGEREEGGRCCVRVEKNVNEEVC